MSHFDFKKHLRKQILIREGWEDVAASQEKENSPLDGMAGEYGLTSGENSNSLLSLLDEYQEEQNKLGKEEFTDEQKVEIVGIIRDLAKKKGIALEEQEVSLTGLRSERDRHLPAQDVLNLLNKIGLDREHQVEIAKIIDEWGRLNSVKFNTPPRAIHPDSEEEGDDTGGDDREAKLAAKEKEWDEKGLNKTRGEPIVADDEDFAGETPEEIPGEIPGETPGEISRAVAGVGDKEFCKGLLDSIKASDPKLFDAMEDDDTIRGAVANFANDLSFSADAVVLSALGAAAAIPPAAPVLGAIASGAEVVARSGAAVAVAMDLMLGNPTDALIDSIGLIPWGKWFSKALGKSGKALTKAGEEAANKGAQKLLKTAGKGAEGVAKSVKNLEKTLAEKLLKAAPALGKEGSKNAAKAIMVAVEQRVRTKLNAGGYGEGAPDPNKYKDPKEYKRALKEWQKARKEAIEGEYENCFRADNLEIKNRALKFIELANDYVDDFPEAFDAVIGKGIDAVVWAKDYIFDQDAMGAPPPLSAKPTAKELNEQRYRMLLKRFNI